MATQLGKAIRDDIADLADFAMRKAVPHLSSLDKKGNASLARAKSSGRKERKWLPYSVGLSLLIATTGIVWILHDLPFG